jgi:predicted CxxxxCH...CXXCH cytochrome family protein
VLLVLRSNGARAALLAATALAAAGCDVARPLGGGPKECERCHGGGRLGAAPPPTTLGATDPIERGVGAHEAHLVGGRVSGPVACAECHVVPEQRHGHYGDGVVVTFGPLARARGATPTWDSSGATCSGAYCHGGTLAGGTVTSPAWTTVDGSPVACGACHGAPPPPPHPQAPAGALCHLCHPATVLDDHRTVDVAGGKHVNGALDLAGGGVCGACHASPPDSGAHRAHVASSVEVAYGALHVLEDVASSGAGYEFGCGHCHPVDPARHVNGVVEVDLSPAGAPPGALKERNDPAATYAGGACAGTYCHSSGQATPAFRTTPTWTSAPGSLGCSGCHDNPPRYQTGGPGAADANSHLGLAEDGWESGHFGGLPGPWHTSYHGRSDISEDAAPITCQTCHFETTDPAAAGPSGFYWLDTTGDYVLPGGLLAYTCAECHTGEPGAPPVGVGRVRPLTHVNGRRDVAFDPRIALPALAWLPAAPHTPTRPYWVTASPSELPLDATLDGTTMSLHLAGASYDPATKTCSSVACHLDGSAAVVWGGLNRWGACQNCHSW